MVISTGSFPKALQGKDSKKKSKEDKAPPLFAYGKSKKK
jgi:hypothetical protein